MQAKHFFQREIFDAKTHPPRQHPLGRPTTKASKKSAST